MQIYEKMKRFIKFILKISIIIILLFSMSSIYGQNKINNWHLKINYASLKPFIENDLWFVTNEAYHIHPRTEDYTPGLSLSAEYEVLNRLSIELMVLYGHPKAVLGIIDQNSAREPVFEKRYNFFSLLISPNISILKGTRGKLYISPICGWGMTSEVSITPTFGPEVTWNKTGEFIYGGKTGFWLNLKNELLAFNAEFIYLSLSAVITENDTNQELNKAFGPLGILFGLSYQL